MTPADRPLDTQTAAPPVVPPRRPIVGIAIADEGRNPDRLRQLIEQLALELRASRASVARIG